MIKRLTNFISGLLAPGAVYALIFLLQKDTDFLYAQRTALPKTLHGTGLPGALHGTGLPEALHGTGLPEVLPGTALPEALPGTGLSGTQPVSWLADALQKSVLFRLSHGSLAVCVLFFLVPVVFFVIYALTGGDDRYRFLPFPKRAMRLFTAPLIPAFAGLSIARYTVNDLRGTIAYALIAAAIGIFYILFFGLSTDATAKAIDAMSGREFEEFCARVLSRNGYHRVRVTQASNDYGADITAWRDGEKWVFQCKRYDTRLGSDPIQEVVAAKNYYDADRAAVMTNSDFTEHAEELAELNDVLLIERQELMHMKRRV